MLKQITKRYEAYRLRGIDARLQMLHEQRAGLDQLIKEAEVERARIQTPFAQTITGRKYQWGGV